MKRIIFTLILVIGVMLTLVITSFAKDVTTLDQIKEDIANAVAGDELVFDMRADIIIPDTADAIILDKDITVTINTNGYLIFCDSKGGSAGAVYGIRLKSKGAKIVLNGATTNVDYKTYTTPVDEQITLVNGEIKNPNKEKGIQSPDMVATGPAIVCNSGTIVLNNFYMKGYNGGEWTIFFYPSLGEVEQSNNITATNSIIIAPSNRYAAIGTRNAGGNLVEALVQMDNCVFTGTGTVEWLAMSANSYIRNSRVAENHLKIDSYLKGGYAKGESEAVLQNVIFENTISSNTGTTDVNMIDCTFVGDGGMSIYVTGDSAGKTRFTITESATCTEAGRQAYIETSKGGGKTITSFDQLPNVVAEYSDNNPAKGHSPSEHPIALEYINGFDKKGLYSYNCSTCKVEYTESTPNANPMIIAIGYSLKEDVSNGYGIANGYIINHELREQYERLTGIKIDFGVLMFNVNSDQAKALTDSLFKAGKLTITEKALQIQATNDSYSSINIFISGIKETSFGLELALAFYLTEIEGDGEDATYKTSFVQCDDDSPESTYTNGGVSLQTITYYSLTGTPKPQE